MSAYNVHVRLQIQLMPDKLILQFQKNPAVLSVILLEQFFVNRARYDCVIP